MMLRSTAWAALAVLSTVATAGVDPEVNLHKAEQAVKGPRAVLAKHALALSEVEQAKKALNSSLQTLGTQRSFTGDPEGAMEAFDEQAALFRRAANRYADDTDRLAAASVEDALDAIVREARRHRIVILNEAHHVPMHRAFAMRLARELRKIGYSWLAAETFENTPFEKGYLALSDGYYSREPVYGNFLRDAARDGWKMVQYEPFDEVEGESFDQRSERREVGQARNLVDRIFAKDPAAKAFIFVGYGHASEMPRVGNGVGTAMMAALLKHMTGLDPLTIDQVAMMAHVKQEAEHAMYDKALARAARATPFVLRSPAGGYEVFGGPRYAMDMQVVHPRYGMDSASGRPDWMQSLAGFKPSAAPRELLPVTGAKLAYAHVKGEPADSVPADVIRLEAGKPAPRFMLPPGDYVYSVRD
jgi:hypothetical protein